MRSHISGLYLLPLGAALLASLACTPTAHAAYIANNDASFSYTGTVTAPGGNTYSITPYTSTPGTTTYTGRDASIYAASGHGYGNITMFLTNWYAGSSNPNNKNDGFFQLVDWDNDAVTSAFGRWTDRTYTTFALSIVGGASAAATPGDNRLWAAPHATGASTTTYGHFDSYALNLAATFAPGAVTEESPGWFSTSALPTSVSGSISGTFENTGSEPSYNGTYGFNLTFQDQSWAGANVPGPTSYFASSEVPEPASAVLIGSALLGLGLIRRRKRG